MLLQIQKVAIAFVISISIGFIEMPVIESFITGLSDFSICRKFFIINLTTLITKRQINQFLNFQFLALTFLNSPAYSIDEHYYKAMTIMCDEVINAHARYKGLRVDKEQVFGEFKGLSATARVMGYIEGYITGKNK